MGWWSRRLRESREAASDATRDADGSSTHRIDQAGTSERRREIVAALKVHLETVHRSKATVAERLDFDPHVDLYEAGYLDSIGASEFLLLAERQYGVSLPDWLIGGQASTLSALAAYIEGELAPHRS
jgi:acyl carrier protein